MQPTPLILAHLGAALCATALGPFVLWARRRGVPARPALHRVLGTVWVALMLATVLTAAFIRDFRLPNLGGLTPIHLLVPLCLLGLWRAFHHLRHGHIAGHRRLMQVVYVGACLVAGAFTLVPGRYLGDQLRTALGLA